MVGGPDVAVALNAADLGVEPLEQRAHAALVAQRRQRGQRLLDAAAELERRRQEVHLLAAQQLLRPPVRVVAVVEAQRAARAGQVVEQPVALRLLDLLLDPALEGQLGGLARGHDEQPNWLYPMGV